MIRSADRGDTTMSSSGSGSAPRKRWLAFSVVVAASMMDLLDATVAQVAGPVIRDDLGGSLADLQWMTAAYTLAMAVMLLTGGRLGDIFGRRRMLLIGASGFTLASIAVAAAPSMELLIAARTLQGAFGAVMLPQGFGLIRELFPPQDLGKVWGIFGPIAGLSAILGPVVAGLLIHAADWRAIFLVNVPVGAFVVLAGAKLLPETASTGGAASARRRNAIRGRAVRGRIDVRGFLIGGAGMALLVYPLVQGRELGWPAWSKLMLVASLPVLALFAYTQLARKRAGGTPLIEPSVFAKRSYVSGVVFAMVFLGTMGGLTLTLTVLLQLGLGYSPIHASLTTAPYALGGFAGSAAGGMLLAKLGRTILQAGLVVKGAGIVALYVALHDSSLSTIDFVAPLFVAGIGMGMVFVPLFDIVLGGVEDHEVGSASSVLQAMQQLGMSLGIAGIGTLLFGLIDTRGYVSAAQATTIVVGVLIVAAFLLAFALPRPERTEAPEAVPAPA
jgi:EmrB/QacA subfamily drug resistance transporter